MQDNLPPNRFNELPNFTQDFIAELREEDVEELREAIKFIRSAKTVGKFSKWMLLTAISMFMGAVALGEYIIKLKGWFK